jgi:phosphate transport system protein
MLKKLLEILNTRGDLIDVSKEEIISMLSISKEMFSLTCEAMEQNVGHSVKKSIGKIDKELNEKRKNIKQMVFEHLVVSGAKDLVQSIRFFTMSNSIERIGDYVKNLAEVLDYLEEAIKIREDLKEGFNQILVDTVLMFDKTIEAIKENNEEKATEVIVKYRNVSSICENTIREIITQKENCISKSDARTLMMTRFIKRVAAHLKNVTRSIKDPIESCLSYNDLD